MVRWEAREVERVQELIGEVGIICHDTTPEQYCRLAVLVHIVRALRE